MLVSVSDRSVPGRSGNDAKPPSPVAALPTETFRTRLGDIRPRYRIGAAVVVVVVVAALVFVRLRGSTDDSAAAAAGPTTAAGAAPAPTVTTVPTTAAPEADAARRTAFVQSMTRLGLTDPQGNCVADKVAEQMGWSKFGVNLLDSENSKILTGLILSCVKPG
jgi:hypothetical protein